MQIYNLFLQINVYMQQIHTEFRINSDKKT